MVSLMLPSLNSVSNLFILMSFTRLFPTIRANCDDAYISIQMKYVSKPNWRKRKSPGAMILDHADGKITWEAFLRQLGV